MTSAPATLLFDLGGTLVDSAAGITASNLHALARMGVPAPDAAVLRSWIGPPLWHNFASVFADAEDIERAVGFYREYYDRDGWRQYEVYPQIEQVLRTLHARGHRLAVVTAKNLPHARRVVASLPFGELFIGIMGPDPGSREQGKAGLVAEALQRFEVAAADCWMIGDRHLDIAGAHAHGVRAIGVLWGFGDRGELAAADALADLPNDLLALLA